jgi:hypothetical protein
MFFTQLEWPWRVRIWDFKFRASHSATVLSSLHVAKTRESKNLKHTMHLTVLQYLLQLNISSVDQDISCYDKTWKYILEATEAHHCTLCCYLLVNKIFTQHTSQTPPLQLNYTPLLCLCLVPLLYLQIVQVFLIPTTHPTCLNLLFHHLIAVTKL